MKCASGCRRSVLLSMNSLAILLMQILRSRWFVVGVHAGLWALLALGLAHFGAKAPSYRDSTSGPALNPSPVPVTRLGAVFAAAPQCLALGSTNELNPFYTKYFTPAPAPAPPPPTTRKIEVTYQGFYDDGQGATYAVVKLADAFLSTRVGLPLATNHYVAQVTLQSLLLTNPAAQTNLLPINVKKEIEVPIK